MFTRIVLPAGPSKPINGFITAPRHINLYHQTRNVSSSPYGRAHVWKNRRNKLPNPIVPIFPQKVILSDGSTFVHYTTSPRSTIRLTRDLTNNPTWNYGMTKGGMFEDEEGSSGRMGRFRRKFEELTHNLDWVVDESDITSEAVALEAAAKAERAAAKAAKVKVEEVVKAPVKTAGKTKKK